MPYSPSHSYVFVAIPKTGTTSMISALRSLHSRDGGSLELRQEWITSEFRQRYGLDALGDRQPGRAKHLSAAQLRLILGPDEFEKCFVFTIVRNSWARVVSRYNYNHVKSRPPDHKRARRGTARTFHDLDFEPWLENAWQKWSGGKGQRSQLSKLTDADGQVLVDHVGRLSNAQGTMELLCQRLGTEPVDVGTVNPSARRMAYSEYYNARTTEMVAEMHHIDIEYFGFRFEELLEQE